MTLKSHIQYTYTYTSTHTYTHTYFLNLCSIALKFVELFVYSGWRYWWGYVQIVIRILSCILIIYATKDNRDFSSWFKKPEDSTESNQPQAPQIFSTSNFSNFNPPPPEYAPKEEQSTQYGFSNNYASVYDWSKK